MGFMEIFESNTEVGDKIAELYATYHRDLKAGQVVPGALKNGLIPLIPVAFKEMVDKMIAKGGASRRENLGFHRWIPGQPILFPEGIERLYVNELNGNVLTIRDSEHNDEYANIEKILVNMPKLDELTR